MNPRQTTRRSLA